jgi:hypothetical protein
MVGRLLTLGPTQIDQFSLTKDALELVDKEFVEVIFFIILRSLNLFSIIDN